jgi:hypothetical protein
MGTRTRAVVVLTLGLSVLLAPAGARAQRQRTGFIRIVSSTTGATVSVDGNEVGTIPITEPIEVTAGEHALQISRRGYTSYNEEIRVRSGQTFDVEVDLLPLSGFLRVRATQSEVRVFVDGNFIGNAPLEFDLPPGRHSIKASKPGFHDFLREVTAEAGSEIALEVDLRPLPADRNPYVRRRARPARWYEKSWVWITAGTVVVVAAAVTVGVAIASSDEAAIDEFCSGQPPCVSRVDFR